MSPAPAPPTPAPSDPAPPVPDAAGWTLAAGLSLSLHIGLAGLVVMGLTATPGAAPGPDTEIVLSSVPMMSQDRPEQAPRLRASDPEARLAPQEDELPGPVEDMAARPAMQAIRPEQAPAEAPSATPDATPPPAASATAPPPERLSAMIPQPPDASLPETARAAPTRSEALRPDPTTGPRVSASGAGIAPVVTPDAALRSEAALSRAQPSQDMPRQSDSALSPAQPLQEMPRRSEAALGPAQSTQEDPTRTETAALDPAARAQEMPPRRTAALPPSPDAEPVRTQPLQPSQPSAAAPADTPDTPARLRPDSPAPQPATAPSQEPDRAAPSRDAEPARTQPLRADSPAPQQADPAPPRDTARSAADPRASTRAGDTLRMAMQPPAEDTLARALRDRPRTFLSDRRAAPRPAAGSGPGAGGPNDSPAPDQPLYSAVLEYLRSLPDIPCFAALPALDAAGALRFEVFGPAQTGLEAFRTGLEAETGMVPGMVLRAVTQGQCETLDFIRRSRDYPAYALHITLAGRTIASGGQLEGQIHDTRARVPHLLLIDTAGRVQTLERFLRPAGDATTTGFAVPMSLQGPPVESWHLLLAITTDSPLATIDTLSGPQEPAPFFARLRAEIATRGLTPDLALIAFSLN